MKEMLKRAARTFVQAALGYVAANLIYIVSSSPENFDYMKNTVMGLVISAVAAGLSAVMNMPKKPKDGCLCGDADSLSDGSTGDSTGDLEPNQEPDMAGAEPDTDLKADADTDTAANPGISSDVGADADLSEEFEELDFSEI